MLSSLLAMQRIDAARFILRLAFFLPLVFVPAIGNWIMDSPAFERWQMRFVNRAADELLHGRSVLLTPCDRPLKLVLIERRAEPGAVIIFGGSRASQISSAWFEPNRALNLSVSEGGVDDAVSLFEMCVEADKVPSLVVLELDPALMHERHPENWVAISDYFNKALARYGLAARQRSREGLLSLDHIQSELRFLLGAQWRAVRTDDSRYHLLPDGTLSFPLAERELLPSQVDAYVTSRLRNEDPNLLRWRTSGAGEFEKSLLRHFLDDLEARHVRVVVFLAPVHRIAYEFYRKLGGYDESWIRAEMMSRGITVAGSYSPFVTGATNRDFFDEVHPRAPIVYRLLREAGVVGRLPGDAFAATSARGLELRQASGMK
jgi:hypothetical protein